MNDKLLDALLTYSKEKILRVVNILVWASLLFISYNKYVNKLDYKVLTSLEKLNDYFLSGDYVVFIGWFICLVVVYHLLKYVLIIIIPASTFGVKFFLKYLIPNEYKIPLLNVYYKKTIDANQEHIKKAIEFWDDETIDGNIDNKKTLSIIAGIIIKLLFVLIIVLNNFSGVSYLIVLMSIILCVLFLVFIMSSITLLVGKNLIGTILGH